MVASLPFLIFGSLTVLALVAFMVVLVSMGRRHPDVNEDVTVLKVVRAGSLVYGFIVGLATVVAVVGQLTSDVVDVSLPTRTFWPAPPDGVTIEPAAATVVGGGFNVAEVSVAGLSVATRAMLATGSLIQGLVFLTVIAAVYLLAQRMLQGEPFRPMLSRSLQVAAVALVSGGVLWQVFFGIGQSMAATEALQISGWTSEQRSGTFDPTMVLPQSAEFMVYVQFWPVFTGLALAALAAAFRHAERLQRDTTGLV
ncbi:hypothetical protein LKO27_10145 [Tessaracoccus sp. OS52]|uniref:hypothetical protein n=1 Tax=Tessaracoccus sp. OS52 TaxID=2886691 RepID=UPI001D11AC09|nr:hypothetical protein [Tessaracoccus sp. OS52]MCC2593765.1 hypothetical protein [Tessaracoccus sp. OS52]